MLFFFVLIQKRTPDIASLIGTGKKNQGEIEGVSLAVVDVNCDFARKPPKRGWIVDHTFHLLFVLALSAVIPLAFVIVVRF